MHDVTATRRNLEGGLILQSDKIRMVLVFFLLALTVSAGGSIVREPRVAAWAISMATLLTIWSHFFLRWDQLLVRGRLPLVVTLFMLFDVAWLWLFVAASGGAASPFWGLLLLPVVFSAAFFGAAAFVTPLTAALVCVLLALMANAAPASVEVAWDTLGRILLVLVVAWFSWGLSRILERERQANQRIVANLTEGVLLVNTEGHVLLANPEMGRLCALPVESIIGLDLLNATDRPGFALLQKMTEGLRERPQGPGHAEIVVTGSEVTDLRCTVVPLGGRRPLGWVVVVQDITDFKAVTRMKEQGLGLLSHELRSPLASMQGMAMVLTRLADGLTVEDRNRAISVIARESDRLSHLVSDLMDMTQLEQAAYSLNRQPVCAAELVEAVADLYVLRAQDTGVRLTCQVPADLPPMVGDFRRLVQVVSNLVDNALKHTPAGGEITITAEARNMRGRICVSDTGPGIPPEDHERIFEKFGRSQPEADNGNADNGLGMGLYIARLLARKHGGDLLLRSEPGHGAEFTLILPLVEALRGSTRNPELVAGEVHSALALSST